MNDLKYSRDLQRLMREQRMRRAKEMLAPLGWQIGMIAVVIVWLSLG